MSHKTHEDLVYAEWSSVNGRSPGEFSRGSNFRATWECKEGHTWNVSIKERNKGSRCPFCARYRCWPGFNDLKTTHPELSKQWDLEKNPDLPSEVLSGSTKKVWWIGGCGHSWEESPNARAHKNRGCPVCAGKRVQRGVNDLGTAHPELVEEWSPENLLSPFEVSAGSSKKVWWRCKKGHEWEALVHTRSKGTGCPYCSGRRVTPGVNDLLTKNPRIAKEWHPENEGDPYSTQWHSNKRVKWLCSKGHEWENTVTSRVFEDSGCRQCGFQGSSQAEQQVAEFVRSLGVEVKTHDRRVSRGFEYDLTAANPRVAIEFNGLYWHSEKHKNGNDYHLRKTRAAENAGYRLIHVWEDDWRDRREIVEKMIARKLGVSDEPRFNARSLQVTQLKAAQAREFLDSHHIQGFASGSWYGALKDGTGVRAVMVMKRRNNGDWELARYATSAIVRGGHSKLLKAFIREQDPRRIVTFADRGVSDGGLYKACGFAADGEIAPDYTYLFKNSRVHKFNFRKTRFRDDPNLKFEEGLTERQLADLNGLDRIYDAGKVRWVWSAV